MRSWMKKAKIKSIFRRDDFQSLFSGKHTVEFVMSFRRGRGALCTQKAFKILHQQFAKREPQKSEVIKVILLL